MRDVERLLRSVAEALRPDGRFVATFRDYRDLPMDERRFISVRSDSERIQTCFLEAMDERIRVHDIIHERVHDAWAMKVSSYEKLRLAPEAVLRAAERVGLRCCIEPGPRGMVMVVAESPSRMRDVA